MPAGEGTGQECTTHGPWPESDVGGRSSLVDNHQRSEVAGQWHPQSRPGVGVVHDKDRRSEGETMQVGASDALDSIAACARIVAQGQESSPVSSDSERPNKHPGTV